MKRWSVRHVPQLFAAALLLIGIVAFTTTPTGTFAGSKYLSVPLNGQAESQWCWASSIQMIMAYHGIVASQCDIVDTAYSGCPNEPGSLNQAVSAFTHYGFDSDGGTSMILGPKMLVNQIDANRPFFARWRWGSGSTGHIVVVRGYHSDSSGNATRVYYNDPLPVNEGYQTYLPYDDFVNNGNHTWTHTIWNIHR